MTMREKMARVMYEADVAALRAIAKNPDDVVATDFALWSEGYFRRVDAALDALMKPTKAMMESAMPYMDSFLSNGAWWEAMITAAKDGK